MADQRILVTGAAGGIGRLMRPRLARPDRVLRLLDIAPQHPAGPGERVEIVTGSLTDPEVAAAACRDVHAVIHLGGLSREDTWARMLEINIDGTHTVLEAARAAGVPRVILASSNHAVGFRRIGEAGPDGLPPDSSPRPDTYYGVSKAAMEALGSLYHSRFGMDITCLRIGSCFERPADVRQLSIWLSPNDCARLLESCLATDKPGYRVLWAVSANTRTVVSLHEAAAIGYHSEDDAELYAAEVPPGKLPDYLGGTFCECPLGQPNPL
ncbi:NAD(P)-dependent oxidoreductase [Nocardia terpenica]|uniref:NAD-dependent epimerase/dehydratase family protein n=1 Tax=Nocardia terpenica TaxID=455432 RepID=UPI00189314F9|nr:NAD(P)-dependent oxidoreductase [Nocardia terpenica]MBF6060374.1 NAD(P)-dependent oxidoreductase [Nocardia terpenica]MBF6103634.1 NAD(P)-dependent oxidoreductase [Nocardia terpenica]MBF6111992.1 NAD(P)-dependent oxidoreductase [Nocardia terpenica]MBF6117855.1 NAD(P)-dependent oxidoreductase [Nocardia terpenica]MBF6153401.1 NAD(P)-dependent oxidoreductase [Nocardia terpenica]